MTVNLAPQYKVLSARTSFECLAQKYALAKLLLSDSESASDIEALHQCALTKRVLHLHERRQARLRQLLALRTQLFSGAKLIRMLRCPPALVWTREAATPCGYTRHCPWCWCRKVVAPLYRAAAYVVYGGPCADYCDPRTNKRVPIRPLPLNLAAIESAESWLRQGSLRHLLDAAKTKLSDHNNRTLFGRALAGSYASLSVDVTADKWLASFRVLALVRPNFDFSIDDVVGEQPSLYVVRYDVDNPSGLSELNPQSIALAVGRTAAFPALSVTADVETLLEYAQALIVPGPILLARVRGNLRTKTTLTDNED